MHPTVAARAVGQGEAALPQSLTVSLGELAGAVKEGLLAFSVGVGLEVLQLLMEEDVTALAGPKGRHDPARGAVRHGYEDGSVTLGGRCCTGNEVTERRDFRHGEVVPGVVELEVTVPRRRPAK